jgi:hypothetical protein
LRELKLIAEEEMERFEGKCRYVANYCKLGGLTAQNKEAFPRSKHPLCKQGPIEVVRRAIRPVAQGGRLTDINQSLDIHINKTGRVCLRGPVARRIGDLPYTWVNAKGRTVRMIAEAQRGAEALEIRTAPGHRYVSAMCLLRTMGFDASVSLDVKAEPLDSIGFEFTLR